jgi:ComEC/Rec2-related protein
MDILTGGIRSEASQEERGFRPRPLIGFALSFVAGIAAGLYGDFRPAALGGATAIAFSAALLLHLAAQRFRAFHAAATGAIHLCLALCACALVLAHAPAGGDRLVQLLKTEGTPMQLRGTVEGDPDSGSRQQQGSFAWTFPFRVEAWRASTNSSWQAANGDVIVTWYSPRIQSAPSYGDRWILDGAAGRFRERGIRIEKLSFRARPAQSIREEKGAKRDLASRCYAARRSALRYLAMGIEDRPVETGIYQSLLLGYRWGLTREAQDLFAASGTIHIFAVSGSHVVIIAGLIIFALRVFRVSRPYWVLALAPLLIAYTVAVGGQSSAVRACLMAILFFLAPLIGRRPDVPATLAMAAILILGFAPEQLLDVGFICSFVVVIGLIVLCPRFDRVVRAWCAVDPMQLQPESVPRRAARSAGTALLSLAAVSLAAWLTAAPLTAYYFGRFSLITLPSNLFVIPLSFLIIVSGCLSLLLGPCLAVVGEWFNHASLALVWLLVHGTEWMVRIPGGALRVPPPPAWAVWLWYATLAVAVSLRWNKERSST